MIDKFEGEYRFLSNFYPSELTVKMWCIEPLERAIKTVTFPTAEHAYQANKSHYESDWLKVNSCKTPGQAKKMGRKITMRDDWERIKLAAMHHIVRAKFNQNTDFQRMLLSTGDQHLEEGNTWGDKYWGVCDGEGYNHLGQILMLVRTELNNV